MPMSTNWFWKKVLYLSLKNFCLKLHESTLFVTISFHVTFKVLCVCDTSGEVVSFNTHWSAFIAVDAKYDENLWNFSPVIAKKPLAPVVSTTSVILSSVVSEMTYTVSSGTLNPSIPYHTILSSKKIQNEERLVPSTIMAVKTDRGRADIALEEGMTKHRDMWCYTGC